GGTLEYSRKKTRSPVLGIALGEPSSERVIHDYESRQVLTDGTKTVRDPRSYARVAHPTEPGIDLEESGGVVVGLGEARVQKRHVIHVLRHFREYFRCPCAALPMPLELEGRTHDRPDLVRE